MNIFIEYLSAEHFGQIILAKQLGPQGRHLQQISTVARLIRAANLHLSAFPQGFLAWSELNWREA